MKSSLSLLFLICCSTSLFAQSSTDPQGTKTVPPVKAEPAVSSINTVPVAPVDKKIAPATGSVSPTPATRPVTAQIDNTGSVAPATQKVVPAKPVADVPVNSTNTGVLVPASVKPVDQITAPTSLNPVSPQSIQPAASTEIAEKPVQVQSIKARTVSAAPATAPVNEQSVQPVSATPVSPKAPEVKLDNTKPVKMEEVPPSTTTPTQKQPVVPMQRSEKQKSKE